MEEDMLENDSYWDVDILAEHNAPILAELEKWKEKYKNAVNGLGKWYCQIQIDKLEKQIKHYQ